MLIHVYCCFLSQAVLDDFDYSDDEDSLDRASRLVRQKEREAVAQIPSSNAPERWAFEGFSGQEKCPD